MNSTDRFIVGSILGLLVFNTFILLPDLLHRIERKLDEMNQCGPVEVQVSDE